MPEMALLEKPVVVESIQPFSLLGVNYPVKKRS
jgi:hypothetical protein